MTSDIPHPLIWLYGNYVASAARRGNRDGDKGAFYKKPPPLLPQRGARAQRRGQINDTAGGNPCMKHPAACKPSLNRA